VKFLRLQIANTNPTSGTELAD